MSWSDPVELLLALAPELLKCHPEPAYLHSHPSYRWYFAASADQHSYLMSLVALEQVACIRR